MVSLAACHDRFMVRETREPTEAMLSLRARRAATGLSIRRAAPLLGIAWQTLANAEVGNWKVTPERLADLLDRYDQAEASDDGR